MTQLTVHESGREKIVLDCRSDPIQAKRHQPDPSYLEYRNWGFIRVSYSFASKNKCADQTLHMRRLICEQSGQRCFFNEFEASTLVNIRVFEALARAF